ncbi:bifunctional metallophosphatase/5'-nucleotidase [Sulfoacidibacillus thermotolerans]|uniref:Bifunctional metallophosphatase/5'-nucleotidase n=1 Tax=Sulfoacidibacillus thermotolerans TaxID=1765684 RepID=A0A2U3DA04_SULT2|nr:bifunctional UDP-sugar hydrolase/5'-nucleotidase [Sulfoacidibacillus thermotolerans]PWI58101.1 hypothetical protein BM613_05405 [Sulfoacidibacillus thermotolerans]
MELHILHTNDVHSELERFSHLATRLRARYDELRAQGRDVLCFDLGDHIDVSNPLSNATAGAINAHILHTLPYNGWVLGNNETLTVDKREWARLAKIAGIPLFCSNLTVPGLDDDVDGNLRNGKLYEFAGVKIGVFGVTVRYEKSFATLGIEAEDPLETAWRVARELRASGADLVILLSHLGLHLDQALADEGLPVDVIIGGHTHHFLDGGEYRSGIWIMQAGKHAHAFGHAVLQINAKRRLESVTATLVYTDAQGVADRHVVEAMDSMQEEALMWLDHPVAELPVHLSHSLFGESEIVNLLCDELRSELSSDLAILNGGVITGGYLAGTIRRRDLLAICATPMRPVRLSVTGETLLRLIEEGNQEQLVRRQGFGFGFRGHFVGRLHVSGATLYMAQTTATDQQIAPRVLRMEIGEETLDPERVYTVATSEYVALSPMYKALRGIEFSYYAPILRAFLGRALANPQRVIAAQKPRYHWV